MPCYDPRDRADEAALKRDAVSAKAEAARLADRSAMLTKILCNAGRHIYTGTPLSNEAIVYFEAHREMDERAGRPWVDRNITKMADSESKGYVVSPNAYSAVEKSAGYKLTRFVKDGIITEEKYRDILESIIKRTVECVIDGEIKI